MTSPSPLDKVRATVEKILAGRVDRIDDHDDIFAMGIDSVATMMLLSELELAFGIDLSDDQLSYDQLRSIADITRLIEGLLAGR
ncbi:MAG: acyl carrier protein [Gallionellaceae bacterium]|nr:acyl carrier protein [Gallionellaceae bacterium]MDD5365339.1 acyl carrier protein [Gallionellaceae bacterium]